MVVDLFEVWKCSFALRSLCFGMLLSIRTLFRINLLLYACYVLFVLVRHQHRHAKLLVLLCSVGSSTKRKTPKTK